MSEPELSKDIISYIEKIKDLLSIDIFPNILMDCTKNEILTLWLLYRKREVNMSQAAEYIGVPLNTATGIIARMEKRGLVIRERSMEDKRVVIIRFGAEGEKLIQAVIKEMIYYAGKIFASLDSEEIQLMIRISDKLLEVLKEERLKEKKVSKIRKIEIL